MKKKIKIMPSRTGYDLAAAGYDKKEKYLNSFEQNKILPLLGDIRGLKILDAGAGTGRLAVELSRQGAKVFALDVSEEMLKVLSSKDKKIKTVIGDVEELPFEENFFDWIVSAFVIVHLKDPTRFFDEVYRVLKDGGRFLLTNINQKEPPEVDTREGKIKIESYYHRPEKVREILESLAFTIEKEVFVKEGENWINQIIVAKK
ncbi:class I SAM-dependent methyltransferase [Patescibacteria group bacterium]|nr:class I SAM-dependent methyltransferase [Patescibacteria group bacterium]MBU1613234.1 class I SAM-dependent methyltransferase [Patescibacteria group bacterium]